MKKLRILVVYLYSCHYLFFHHAFRFFQEDRDTDTDKGQATSPDLNTYLRIRNPEFIPFGRITLV